MGVAESECDAGTLIRVSAGVTIRRVDTGEANQR